MSKASCANSERVKWYHHHLFSVLPNIKFRAPDQHNTWSIKFHWLVFRAWTMDSPAFGLQAEYDGGQIVLRVRFPYLITGLFIPLIPWSIDYKLWRKAKIV